MAVSITYNEGAYQLVRKSGTVDYESDTIKVMFVGSGYVADHNETDVTAAAAFEISVTNYDPGFSGSGRLALTGKTLALNTSLNRTVFSATRPPGRALGVGATIIGFQVYKHDTDDATSIPLWFVAFGTAFVTDGSIFRPVLSGAGLTYIQH